MRYIEALNMYNGDDPSLFLAGGISGCPDWQQDMVAKLRQRTKLVILNPRRAQFQPDKNTEKAQVGWEHHHLRKATAISFWFPKESICPITLFELGAWSITNKKIFVGADPDYPKFQNIQIQMALVRASMTIVTSIEELAEDIIYWEKYGLGL